MRSNKKRFFVLATICSTLLFFSGCKVIEDFLNFEGVFETSDGWEVKLEEVGVTGDAIITKVGSARPGFNGLTLGSNLVWMIERTGDNTWTAQVTDNDINAQAHTYVSGAIILTDKTLTITPTDGTPYKLNKKTNTGGNTGGNGSPEVILQTGVSGTNLNERQTREFNIPAGVKKLVVTIKETVQYGDYNAADLFVRSGVPPTIVYSEYPYKYTWEADAYSKNLNRAIDSCTILNPASGKWYAMLFNTNHSFYYSTLLVEIYK